jgi:ArsR family transcriptional regulator, arsenate/arsenite/antimonite-responsive transcriptional repressor
MEQVGIDLFATRFKALGDATRLRIAALLDERPRSVEELALATGLSAPTVSHHLSKLRAAGFVTNTRDQYYAIYALNHGVVKETLLRLANGSLWKQWSGGGPGEADYDSEVLSRFVVDGRLTTIPRQRKKREAVLRYLAGQFEAGRGYTEREVNEILGAYHEDFATLRRELIMGNHLDRSQGEYRRA